MICQFSLFWNDCPPELIDWLIYLQRSPGNCAPGDTDLDITKLKQTTKMDSSTLPHDQLAKMFPTPPSLEHPSPAECTMEVDHAHVKMEPFSPAPDLTDWWTGGEDFDYTLSSSKFAPLKGLYSDSLPSLNAPSEFRYKPQPRKQQQGGNTPQGPNSGQGGRVGLGSNSGSSRGGGNQQTPLGTPNMKNSPHSPSVEGGPRSMHHNNAGHDIGSPSTAKDQLHKESAR